MKGVIKMSFPESVTWLKAKRGHLAKEFMCREFRSAIELSA
jgi:hypothetical protein